MMNMKKMMTPGMFALVMTVMMTSCVNKLETLSLSSDLGAMVNVTRNLTGFEEVEINGSPTVYFTQADSFSVVVKGPENIIEDIITEKEGNTLVIRNRGKVGIFNISFHDDEHLGVYVTAPDIVGVHLNGSGDFLSDERIDTDKMRIVLRGSGDIDVKNLICDQCDIELIGSGDIDLDRLEAQKVSASLIGSGDVKLGLWNVMDTNLALKGSGDISADFKQGCRTAICDLNGSGDISLSGKLNRFSKQKRGSGDVNIGKLSVEQIK